VIRINRASGNIGQHVASPPPDATVLDLEQRADSDTARIAAGLVV
jgi:hypothetical protein